MWWTCSTKLCDKNGNLLGFVPHIYICHSKPILISIPCLEIRFFNNHYFLVCIFKYCKTLCNSYGLEILGRCFYSNNLRSNQKKRKHKQEKHYRVSEYSFTCLSVVCNDICWKLFVFTVRSRALLWFPLCSRLFLCVPMRLVCILIGICRKLFENHVQSCAFIMISNQPLWHIRQICVLSIL